MLALFYGAFTRLIQRSGDISQPVSITCGLPLDTLSGEEARTTVESIQRWMKAEHTWKANDQEYHLNVTEVRVTSQPAGALFDYVLDDEGKIVPERRSAYTQEVGIVSIGMPKTVNNLIGWRKMKTYIIAIPLFVFTKRLWHYI